MCRRCTAVDDLFSIEIVFLFATARNNNNAREKHRSSSCYVIRRRISRSLLTMKSVYGAYVQYIRYTYVYIKGLPVEN